jgi:hypothetical protein
MADADWERGDLLGHDFPIHLEALRAGGPAFLTRAFRATGSLAEDNRVHSITQLEPFTGGSTGRKAVLRVTYDHPGPDLPEHLFVKFSRDLDDQLRDRGRRQMESEVRFGLLSHIPDFPVAVPRCLFGEYHLESGSGLLISERIAFGSSGIEPHHPKARDYEVDDLGAHYDALVSALARLAGSDRAGRFPEALMAHFEPRRAKVTTSGPAPDAPDQVRARVARYAAFAGRVPQLLPASIRSDAFIAELLAEAPRAVEHADALGAAVQQSAVGLFAFCHWNANIDNAWFWRDEDGDLVCGLMDWGNVGRMNMVKAISSCLFFAEPDFVIEHLDHFLARFSTVFEEAGGGPLDPAALKLQFTLRMVAGGLQWPLDAVALIERHLPDLATVTDRFLRTQLHLLTSVLMLWQASDAPGLIDWAIRRAEDASTAP